MRKLRFSPKGIRSHLEYVRILLLEFRNTLLLAAAVLAQSAVIGQLHALNQE